MINLEKMLQKNDKIYSFQKYIRANHTKCFFFHKQEKRLLFQFTSYINIILLRSDRLIACA